MCKVYLLTSTINYWRKNKISRKNVKRIWMCLPLRLSSSSARYQNNALIIIKLEKKKSIKRIVVLWRAQKNIPTWLNQESHQFFNIWKKISQLFSWRIHDSSQLNYWKYFGFISQGKCPTKKTQVPRPKENC